MTEPEVREALRQAYAARAGINARIDELVRMLKKLSPNYRKIMEQLEG